MVELRAIAKNHYGNKGNGYVYYDVIHDGYLIGNCFIYTGQDYLLEFGNFGYWVFEEFRQLGYATEIVKELLNLFYQSNIDNVLVKVDSKNVYSKRILAKFGFELSEDTNSQYEYFQIRLSHKHNDSYF